MKGILMELSPATPQDLQAFYNHYQSEEYNEFFRHYPDSCDYQSFLAVTTMYGGLYKLIDDDKLLSYLFTTVSPKIKAIIPGILIRKKHQNKGNSVASITYLLNLAFNEYHLEQAICVVSADEPRVNQLLEQGGFTLSCTIPDNCFYNNELHAENRWTMDKPTFNTLTKVHT